MTISCHRVGSLAYNYVGRETVIDRQHDNKIINFKEKIEWKGGTNMTYLLSSSPLWVYALVCPSLDMEIFPAIPLVMGVAGVGSSAV